MIPSASSVICSPLRSARSRCARSNTSSPSPSCRSPRISMTSSSRIRRSTRPLCAISLAADSSHSSATPCWSAAPALARLTSPSRLPAAASALAPAAGSTTSSILLTGSNPKPATATRDGSPLRRSRRARLSAVRPVWRPAAVPPYQPALRAHLGARDHQSGVRRMAERLHGRQDDDRAARSPDPSLRYHRNRKRQLALQEPRRRSCPNPRSRRLRNPDQLRRRKRYRQDSWQEGVKIGRRSGVNFASRLTVKHHWYGETSPWTEQRAEDYNTLNQLEATVADAVGRVVIF